MKNYLAFILSAFLFFFGNPAIAFENLETKNSVGKPMPIHRYGDGKVAVLLAYQYKGKILSLIHI